MENIKLKPQRLLWFAFGLQILLGLFWLVLALASHIKEARRERELTEIQGRVDFARIRIQNATNLVALRVFALQLFDNNMGSPSRFSRQTKYYEYFSWANSAVLVEVAMLNGLVIYALRREKHPTNPEFGPPKQPLDSEGKRAVCAVATKQPRGKSKKT
jgi:hypothetical protein